MRIKIRDGREVAGIGCPGQVLDVSDELATYCIEHGYADPAPDDSSGIGDPVAATGEIPPADGPSTIPGRETASAVGEEGSDDAQPRKRRRA